MDVPAVTDLELVRQAQAGDMRAADTLVRRYEHYVYTFARGLFLPGAERADLNQEALIGIAKGIRDYRADAGSTFKSFLVLCVRRQLITAVHTATRGYQGPLNEAVREAANDDGDVVPIVDMIPNPDTDPAHVVAERAYVRDVLTAVRDDLSPLEREALLGVACGYSYAEIEGVGAAASVKSIDNAMSRGRAKLRRAA